MRRPAAALASAAFSGAALAGCVAPAPAPPPVAVARPVPGGPALAIEGQAIQGGLVRGRTVPGARVTLDGAAVPVAADGAFLLGFDRDAGAGAVVRATLAGTAPGAGTGAETMRVLAVAPRPWDISRLPTLPKVPVPQPEFERRRPAELAQIRAARATPTAATGWRQPFRWPATGRLSTLFGSQRIYANGEAGSFHSGVDIARPTGTPVLAPADGVVVLAAPAPFTLEGNLLIVDHGGGLSSAFLHLSRIDVRVGEAVRQGQPIGAVGATGRATGPHLHWGLVWQGARLDPLLVAGPMGGGDR
jgi:hypothetical protein